MSWRVRSGDFLRYAFICPICGKQRGWPTRLQADRQIVDLVDSGMTAEFRSEFYPDGQDDTCTHVDASEWPKRRV